MTMWLPQGWWIITEKTNKGACFTAGANGLPEIESSSKFRSDSQATDAAQKALRLMAYRNRVPGWSKFRCHAWLPGTLRAFCGAKISDSPSIQKHGNGLGGKCERIVRAIPDPDETETDIKKYFRYVSFNSEKNPDVNRRDKDDQRRNAKYKTTA